MQIKETKRTDVGNAVSLPDGHKIVMDIDTSKFFKDKGETYYSLRIGTNAYLFDDPTRRQNLVIVRYGKGKTKVMNIAWLMFHLIYWKANILFNLPIDDDSIYDLSKPSNKCFNTIIDSIAKKLIDKEEGVTPQICECIANIKESLSVLSQGWSSIQCNTVSIYDIIQFKNRNKEFNRLLNTELDKTHTIKEIELQMKQCEKDLTEVVKSDTENCLHPYVLSGRIKTAQLTKVLVAVGTRPDIDKTILPWPIKRGYIHGLSNVAEYFMETITARDAMLTKTDSVPRSGLLSRQINRLTSSIHINYDVKDCGTQNYLKYTVENQDYLKMAEGKYYLDEEDGNKLKVLSTKDKQLIGKTIKLRTFITCACPNGVCKTCVGTIAQRLRGTRLGTLPSIKSINPLSQKAMSAKHDLGTKSIEITNKAIEKYFHNDGVDFFINDEFATQRDLYIVIESDDIDDLVNSSLDTEDSSIDSTAILNYVAIRDHGEDYVIENEGMKLALSDEVLAEKKAFIDDPENQDLTLIPISKLDNEAPIFSAILDTEEISKYLNNFIGTVDRLSINRFKTYDDLMAEMNRIIYDSGFVNRIIHFESIIYSMIRDVNDSTIRPDFRIKDVPYKILKVSTAIEKKDMYTAISYQGLRRIFKDVDLRRRYGKSVYDPFFRISDLY